MSNDRQFCTATTAAVLHYAKDVDGYMITVNAQIAGPSDLYEMAEKLFKLAAKAEKRAAARNATPLPVPGPKVFDDGPF